MQICPIAPNAAAERAQHSSRQCMQRHKTPAGAENICTNFWQRMCCKHSKHVPVWLWWTPREPMSYNFFVFSLFLILWCTRKTSITLSCKSPDKKGLLYVHPFIMSAVICCMQRASLFRGTQGRCCQNDEVVHLLVCCLFGCVFLNCSVLSPPSFCSNPHHLKRDKWKLS